MATTTEEITIETPVEVKPNEFKFYKDELFNTDFQFIGEDGNVDLSGVNVSLVFDDFTVEFEEDAVGETVVLHLDDDLNERLEEGIKDANFTLEWSGNRRKYPLTVYIVDPASPLPLERVRRKIQDIASENRIHDLKNVFSDELLLQAKVEAVDQYGASAGRHRRYRPSNFPQKFNPQLLNGVMGGAMVEAGQQLGLNQFPYEAAGMAVQADEARMEFLLEMGSRYKQEYQMWINTQQYYDAMSRSFRQIG